MIRIIWRLADNYICLLLLILFGGFDKIKRALGKKKSAVAYNKIVIIKLSALGDTVIMIPILRALRNSLPQAHITALVSKINIGAVYACPFLDKIKILNLGNPTELLKTIMNLHKQRFDLAIDFEQRIKLSSLIAYFTGCDERIGFKTKGYFRDYLYTKKIIHKNSLHEFKCMAELTKDITGEISDTHLEFRVSEEDKKWAEDFLQENNLKEKKIIALHPGCGIKYIKGARAREWPKENFIKLGDSLSGLYNSQILITGGKEECTLAQEIASAMKVKPLILSGKVDIGKLAALLKYCFLFISGDTGILHLAAACGTKTIGIFGPSSPEKWKPLTNNCNIVKSGLACAPCQIFGIDKPKCSEFKCINSISVTDILNVIQNKELNPNRALGMDED